MKSEEKDLLYSPAMLAEYFSVPVAMVNLLFHCGLIQSKLRVGDISYCAASDLASVRQLISLLDCGVSASCIIQRLKEFSDHYPSLRPILNYVVPTPSGKDLLVQSNDTLYDNNGQRYFSFEYDDLDPHDLDPHNKEDFGEHNREGAVNVENTSNEDPFIFNFSDDPDSDLSDAERMDNLCNRLLVDGRAPLTWSAEELEIVRSLIKKHILFLCESAWNLEKTSHWSEARELYRSALFCGGSDPTICFQLAELLQRHGDFAGARERYYSVLELDRNHIDAWFNLAHVQMKLQENKDAVESFKRVLVLQPNNYDVYYELGVLLISLGQKEEGEENLRYYLNKVRSGPHTEDIIQILS